MPGTSTEQVVDKGIRQKSIHSFHSIHSFPDGSAFCPGAPKRVPSDSVKHQRVYTSSNVCHSHEWRVDTASGKTLKKQNACLHAIRHAVENKIACIHGLRSEGVNNNIDLFFSPGPIDGSASLEGVKQWTFEVPFMNLTVASAVATSSNLHWYM